MIVLFGYDHGVPSTTDPVPIEGGVGGLNAHNKDLVRPI